MQLDYARTIVTIFWIYSLRAAVYSNELLLVQLVWRHGERAPIGTYPTDPNQESSWPQGWGALTARGMEQHVNLGKLLRKEYIERLNFLSSGYVSNEIYIRSTDINRTLRSAEADLIGMYYNSPALRAGIDYPNITDWPRGYAPIPVHSVKYSTDYIGNPLCDCPRRDWLWEEAKKTQNFQKLKRDSQKLLNSLTELCGETVTLDNIWFINQATKIERDHDMKTIINESLFAQMTNTVGIVDNMEDGLDLDPYDGIDFRVEIGKIRGGSMLWAMLNRIDHKIYCQNASNNDGSCRWINTLKYYAYSAHDNTITALLTTLGAKRKIIRYGYPGYAAAAIIELWRDASNDYFLQFRFHRFGSNTLEYITDKVDGCEKYATMCPHGIVRQKASVFYPGNPAKLCQDVSSKSTNFTVPKSADLRINTYLLGADAAEEGSPILPWRMQPASSDRCRPCAYSLLQFILVLFLIRISLHR